MEKKKQPAPKRLGECCNLNPDFKNKSDRKLQKGLEVPV